MMKWILKILGRDKNAPKYLTGENNPAPKKKKTPVKKTKAPRKKK